MNTITLQKQSLASASTQIPRTISVTLPAPPWGSLSIDAERKETDPGRRISLCRPVRPSSLENAYTKIRNAIMEVRDDSGWMPD